MAGPYSIEPTPNPNSLKITFPVPVSPGRPLTFRSVDEAAGNDLARTLLGVNGVASVFMIQNFVTVTKDAEATWDEITPRLEVLLQRHLEGA